MRELTCKNCLHYCDGMCLSYIIEVDESSNSCELWSKSGRKPAADNKDTGKIIDFPGNNAYRPAANDSDNDRSGLMSQDEVNAMLADPKE